MDQRGAWALDGREICCIGRLLWRQRDDGRSMTMSFLHCLLLHYHILYPPGLIWPSPPPSWIRKLIIISYLI